MTIWIYLVVSGCQLVFKNGSTFFGMGRYQCEREGLHGPIPALKSTSSSLVRTLTHVTHCNGGCSQFPNLSRFARDILSIPGKFTTNLFSLFNHLPMFLSFYARSAVAVEHIFSGSCDTISLRHVSLNLETIRTLLVKQRLRLARTAVHDILGN